MAGSTQPTSHLHYNYPLSLSLAVAWALLTRRRRRFAADASRLLRTMRPPPQVHSLELIPPDGRFAVVFNHYHSPALPSWWSAIALGALIGARRARGDHGFHWVMTEAWTYPDALRAALVTPVTRYAFRRLAYVYDFVAMPPMPPRPQEVEARARAVRQVLALARKPGTSAIGISPEGRDSPDASLIVPPPGAGRFLLQLAATGLAFVPAGLYEQGGRLLVRFGPLFPLEAPPGLTRQARDRWAAEQVMLAIGRLLPQRLWGAYGERLAAG